MVAVDGGAVDLVAATELKVAGLHIDLVGAPEQLTPVLQALDADCVLSLGVAGASKQRHLANAAIAARGKDRVQVSLPQLTPWQEEEEKQDEDFKAWSDALAMFAGPASLTSLARFRSAAIAMSEANIFLFGGVGTHGPGTDLTALRASPLWAEVAEAVQDLHGEDLPSYLEGHLASTDGEHTATIATIINMLNTSLWCAWGQSPTVVVGLRGRLFMSRVSYADEYGARVTLSGSAAALDRWMTSDQQAVRIPSAHPWPP